MSLRLSRLECQLDGAYRSKMALIDIHMSDRDLDRRIRRIEDKENQILAEDDLILKALHRLEAKRLSYIKLTIGGNMIGPAFLRLPQGPAAADG